MGKLKCLMGTLGDKICATSKSGARHSLLPSLAFGKANKPSWKEKTTRNEYRLEEIIKVLSTRGAGADVAGIIAGYVQDCFFLETMERIKGSNKEKIILTACEELKKILDAEGDMKAYVGKILHELCNLAWTSTHYTLIVEANFVERLVQCMEKYPSSLFIQSRAVYFLLIITGTRQRLTKKHLKIMEQTNALARCLAVLEYHGDNYFLADLVIGVMLNVGKEDCTMLKRFARVAPNLTSILEHVESNTRLPFVPDQSLNNGINALRGMVDP